MVWRSSRDLGRVHIPNLDLSSLVLSFPGCFSHFPVTMASSDSVLWFCNHKLDSTTSFRPNSRRLVRHWVSPGISLKVIFQMREPFPAFLSFCVRTSSSGFYIHLCVFPLQSLQVVGFFVFCFCWFVFKSYPEVLMLSLGGLVWEEITQRRNTRLLLGNTMAFLCCLLLQIPQKRGGVLLRFSGTLAVRQEELGQKGCSSDHGKEVIF